MVHISDGAVLTSDEEPPNILLAGTLLRNKEVELSEVFALPAAPFTAVPLIFDWGAG